MKFLIFKLCKCSSLLQRKIDGSNIFPVRGLWTLSMHVPFGTVILYSKTNKISLQQQGRESQENVESKQNALAYLK